MRWVTYRSADGTERPGLLQDGRVHGLDGTLLGLIESGLAAAAERATARPVEVVDLADVRLAAPIPRPPSVRDFLSFEEHLRNARRALGRDDVPPVWFEQPVFYFSNPAAILGPDDEVPISPGCEAFDYEVEVAAVVGRAGSDLTPAEAEQHIAGYTIFCDWSARDVQARESTVGLGPAKGKDGATSIGPVLVTPDELEPHRSGKGYRLAMRGSVNGRDIGGGSWADIHWSFGQMLAYASRGTELRPGDVIGSGTVGTGCLLELSGLHGSQRYPWLRPGDVVTVEVEQLGSLTGRIVGGPAVVPLS
ncbi:fumarylacetoacetate hydrolase family protein [Pseudonocardia cypriaca]|uniref:2-keto-4-pentenoate hydratase/2-oxohepta-3-ene-1,7-dioic acid hydratase in catechol pathway n=1 Tax=Pseudonocardia cypriaca TaxID=882449 RepID=A0A543FUC9_9PSEU|nr:fumarylacetoacetate hydrolase family protein [Pseudonocardia cypriaca]TQM37448.1 2-keto-4-pentenoate hydratase/2-oxohepta-3-ene-1,7-dioic acid hydratase in catechol pathway [Pseudonocardia cypriaca]